MLNINIELTRGCTHEARSAGIAYSQLVTVFEGKVHEIMTLQGISKINNLSIFHLQNIKEYYDALFDDEQNGDRARSALDPIEQSKIQQMRSVILKNKTQKAAAKNH